MEGRELNLVGPEHMIAHSNPSLNLKYHEIAKEFVNNGMNKTAAYKKVTKCKQKNATNMAYVLFNKPFFIDLVRAYLQGEEESPKTKDWAIKVWTNMVNSNVLDYIDDDFGILTVKELKELPVYVQRSIKKLEVETTTDDDGREVRKIKIELVDKQKALNDLAKAEKWIETHMNITVKAPVSAEQLIEAQMKRAARLRVEDDRTIDGTSERVK
jgi:hypothetical protein